MHAIAKIAHEIPDRPPIRLLAGEVVQAGDRDAEWPEFVFVTASHGAGWVPARHLSALVGTVVVDEPYDTTELPTDIDDTLEVIAEDRQSGWVWCRSTAGREGWVPLKTVVLMDG
jgi:hypothetical protein